MTFNVSVAIDQVGHRFRETKRIVIIIWARFTSSQPDRLEDPASLKTARLLRRQVA